jgi:hypothetical protein
MDPMTLLDGADTLAKVNAYRRGVNQPQTRSNRDADPSAYCANLRSIRPRSAGLLAESTCSRSRASARGP